MDVREIPRILFREFAQNVREKDEVLIGYLEGIEGVVLGLKEKHGNVSLHWWRGEDEVGKSHLSVIEIEAGTTDAGIWAYGRGRSLRECVRFRMAVGKWDLGQGTLAIARILQRASELALSESFETTTFWERDRDSKRPYDKPPP